MGIFSKPDPPKPPPPPPSTPTRADASVIQAGQRDTGVRGLRSLISTGPQGLSRKAQTTKRSLIGGS